MPTTFPPSSACFFVCERGRLRIANTPHVWTDHRSSPPILHLLSQFTLQVGMKWLPLQNINCPCEETRERLEQPRCACALCGEDCGIEGKLELRVNKFDFPPTHPLGGGNARSNRRDAGSDCAPTRCATRRQPQPLQHVCVCARAVDHSQGLKRKGSLKVRGKEERNQRKVTFTLAHCERTNEFPQDLETFEQAFELVEPSGSAAVPCACEGKELWN